MIPGTASSAATGNELEELERCIRAAELHVDADTGMSKWDGRKVGLAEMLDWMFIAERTRDVAQSCSR